MLKGSKLAILGSAVALGVELLSLGSGRGPFAALPFTGQLITVLATAGMLGLAIRDPRSRRARWMMALIFVAAAGSTLVFVAGRHRAVDICGWLAVLLGSVPALVQARKAGAAAVLLLALLLPVEARADRAVLTQPRDLFGIHLDAGTDLETIDGGFIIHAPGAVRRAGAAWAGAATFTFADQVGSVSGALAEPLTVDGIPLAPGAKTTLQGSAAELEAGRPRLGEGVVARDGPVPVGGARVDLVAGDRVALDRERLTLTFDGERALERRYPARGSAAWSRATGKLVEMTAAAPVTVAGIDAAPGEVTFYDGGAPRTLVPAHELARRGLQLGGDRVTFWPGGEVMCALDTGHEVDLAFDPRGEPRLGGPGGRLAFATLTAGALGWRPIPARHPLHGASGPCSDLAVAWLAGTGGPKIHCDRSFGSAGGAAVPVGLEALVNARPATGLFTTTGWVTYTKGSLIGLSTLRSAGLKQPLTPDYDLFVTVPDAQAFELFTRRTVTVAVCDTQSPETRRPAIELRQP